MKSVQTYTTHIDEEVRNGLVYYVIDTLRCRCKEHYDRDKLSTAIYSLLWTAKLGTLPCRIICDIVIYCTEHDTQPTRQTLSNILNEYNIEIQITSDQLLRDILPPDQLETYNCAMCQVAITGDQRVVRLIPCGHIYHNVPSECLGLNQPTVSTWVRQHGRCPMCRAEVTQDFGTPT